MPRSLARLRWKDPPKPFIFPKLSPTNGFLFAKKAEKYVARHSNPPHGKVHTVVNERARRQPAGRSAMTPRRPYTLRDLVDPKGTKEHGEIIYVFRHTITNQIIYSLQELLDTHHLEQLPFFAKKTKPAVLRPDAWTPHCVITFPNAAQGHNAFRKLREFRHLHELAWKKTNPEYSKMKAQRRAKKIMNQRANMSADLAAVLSIQETHGMNVSEEQEKHENESGEWMDKRWKSITDLATAAKSKEKLADNIKWLEHQERSLNAKLKMKHNQNEAAQKRLLAAKEGITTRLRKVSYAVRKAEQFKHMQEDLTTASALASAAGAEQKLAKLRRDAHVLETSLDNPHPTLTHKEIANFRTVLTQLQTEIADLEKAFAAKKTLDNRTHFIAQSVLPRHMRKALPAPYTLQGVRVRWADLEDAMYARGQWPATIEHEALDVYAARRNIALLTKEEYEVQKMTETSKIIAEVQRTREERAQAVVA